MEATVAVFKVAALCGSLQKALVNRCLLRAGARTHFFLFSSVNCLILFFPFVS
uniref:Uncharacterized protein n=1 Tax=Rhizophora mucronata TaxID=61149 RepID=A0A2P2MIJ4_RHIMU